jgi:HAD superfamily hydrolase (TIGR01509 family)
LADERPAQKDQAADEDERDRAEEHAQARTAALLPLLAEGTKGEEEGDRAEDHHDSADRHDARGNANELGVHALDGITMKAALFDFDETMIDLEWQHDEAHRALCRDLGSNYDEMPESFRFGSGRRIVDDIVEMREFFGWREAEEELYARRHRYFMESLSAAPAILPARDREELAGRIAGATQRQIALMPGVERVVRELHGRGITLAITTSAAGDAVDLLLRRFGIRELFALIVDGSEVAAGKPDPEGYLLTARKLEVAPEDCVVFEDSRIGVLAAKAAGMYCVGVRNPGARTHQDLSAADLVLQSFEGASILLRTVVT